MLRPLALALALAALAPPALAADSPREPSPLDRAETLGGFDRVLTYVLMGALIAAIVIATADEGGDGDETPASP